MIWKLHNLVLRPILYVCIWFDENSKKNSPDSIGIEKQSNFCIFKIQDLYKNEYLCEN